MSGNCGLKSELQKMSEHMENIIYSKYWMESKVNILLKIKTNIALSIVSRLEQEM